MTRRWIVPSLLLLATMSLFTAQACGPDFFVDVFVRKLRPDNPKEFAAGKLGVLLPTYPRADLAVAFRYLNGGVLSPAEQQAYHPMDKRPLIDARARHPRAGICPAGAILRDNSHIRAVHNTIRKQFPQSSTQLHPRRHQAIAKMPMHSCHVFQCDALGMPVPPAKGAVSVQNSKRLKIARVSSPRGIIIFLLILQSR